MVQLIWSESAINDLDSIGEYIPLDSEYAAQKFVQELIKKASPLISLPEKGRPIPENIPGNYRQILHKSYQIIHRVHKRTLSLPQYITKKNYYLKYKINDARQNDRSPHKRCGRI